MPAVRAGIMNSGRRSIWCALCAAGLWACAAAPSHAAPSPPFTGIVVRVIDGDSLVMRGPGGGKPIEVRLQDIDAPEICQVWGAQAQKALEDLALTQTAVLRSSATDAYGRTVGRVMVGDIDIGRRMVEEGHAWSTQGRNGRGPLLKQERMAKALNRGLWQGGGAVMPRDFRKAHGPCNLR